MNNSSRFDPDNFHGCRLIQSCGSGAYGEVWMAEEKLTGKRVAIKIISKDDSGRWRDELAGLVNYRHVISSHPNLLEIYHVEENETYFYYSMELADNQDESCKTYRPDTLSNRLEKSSMKLETVINIINPLLNGIESLHKSGLVHHDIKPGNIIFIAGIPKLSDVGLVSQLAHSSAGTPGFVPKEYGSGNPIKPADNFNIDLYALGKVVYCALTGLNAEEFPKWPYAMFTPALKPANLFLLKACSDNASDRFTDVSSFRQALNQSAGPAANPPASRKGAKSAVASFVLGLFGMFAWFIPVIGLPVALTGLILGISGLLGRRKILSTAGITLSTISLIATICNATIGAYQGYKGENPLVNLILKDNQSEEKHTAQNIK